MRDGAKSIGVAPSPDRRNPMKFNPIARFVPLAVGLFAIGCSGSEGDTSPLPPQAPQARMENAQKGVDQSQMTPEQKQAAAEYLKQGAEGAQRMKEIAQPTAGKATGS
jgi:hypothetical protein